MTLATQSTRNSAGEEDDLDRWTAVLARDRGFDGAFVFAVRSTGIYCRPSCASRRPLRKHVAFYPLPEIAEHAGYRPCRRCRPDLQASGDPQVDLVRRVCRLLSEGSESQPTLSALGERVGANSYHLQKVFKCILGVTPRQFADALRVGSLKDRLKQGWSVTNALYDAGYNSSSRLYETASSRLGMTPAAYRRGGRGMVTSYAVSECELGNLLVAATTNGLCAVSLGASPSELEAALRREYPAATVEADSGELRAWTEAVLEHIAGRAPRVDLPLDILGTAFQRRVWEELRRIPYGDTRTYGQVAEAIGRPASARAVAAACASNPVALAVPCQRVVRNDGSVAGYRWGAERKEALLAREQGPGTV